MNPVVSRITDSQEQVLVLDVVANPNGRPLAVIVHEGGRLDSCGLDLLTIEYADGQSWPVGFRFNSLSTNKVPA